MSEPCPTCSGRCTVHGAPCDDCLGTGWVPTMRASDGSTMGLIGLVLLAVTVVAVFSAAVLP